MLIGKFLHQAARGAGQQPRLVWRHADLAIDDDFDAGSTGLGQVAVAQQDDLAGAGFDRLLSQQHVGQQRYRLDVAARPARVDAGDACHAALEHFGARQWQRRAEAEHRGLDIRQWRVVAPVLSAARYLQIDVDIAAAVSADQLPDDAAPLCIAERVTDAQFAQAMRQARQIRRQSPRLATPHRDDFVDTVSKQKAAIQRRDARFAQWHQAAVEITGWQWFGHARLFLEPEQHGVAEPAPQAAFRHIDERVERYRGYRLAIDDYLQLADLGAGAQRCDQPALHRCRGADAAGLSARDHDVDVARRPDTVELLGRFIDARLEHGGPMLLDVDRLVEGKTVIDQRGARVFAPLDAAGAKHHGHHAHVLAPRRGHQAVAGAVGVTGLHAVDR